MGVKKKKSTKEKSSAVVAEVVKPTPPVIMENWVTIDFKLLNWKFMNFSMKFRDNTHMFTIRKLLQERHGRMDDLKMCFNSFADVNEVTDEMLTLKECGVCCAPFNTAVIHTAEGMASEEYRSIPVVQLFYDFKPSNFSDPVILFFK